ncbi:MAG: S8 family serine peptidase [Micromonosporaceae bacterium]|nr:S8 family serine peptidase [Micromonosporaceae bacterium]
MMLAILAGIVVSLAGSAIPAGAHTAAGPTAGEPSNIAPQVQKRVDAKSGDRVQALLMLHNAQRLSGSRGAVVSALKRHANSTHRDLEARLEQHPRTAGDVTVVNRFWVTNMVLVEFTADSQRLQAMAAMSGVRRVIPNFAVSLPKPAESTGPGAASEHLTWGLERIQAEKVWDELGVDGSGVRVATLDTGVDISHPDLAGKMVTDNPSDPNYPGGWMEFNSSGNLVRSQPHDSHYHGTHVSGTIQGGDESGTAIGVAPAAEMMHGLVIPGGGGTFAQVAAGMQWAVAPTDADGNPAGEPADVVNMSLGGNGFHDEMIAPTRAIRAAGAFPAFAIGNSCGSLGTASPGNVYDAVGVGATDESDNVASFSCGGVIDKSRWSNPPADWPDSYVKPDISAPGVGVWSASPGGGYRTLSGTSMATPHTAGTVALMRSAAPELSVDQVFDGLADTAFWDDRYADQPPDTRFGEGRINAYLATREVAIDSGISGTVTDTSTGKPVNGATVTVTPGDRKITTGSDGRYTVRVEPGAYSVATSAFGYRDATTDNVQVTADNFTTVDTTLARGPRGNISGAVTFDQSGEGVPGVTVALEGTPVPFTATSGVDGRYTIADVPVGTYTVAASHPRFTAPSAVEVTVSEGGTAEADHVFGAPPRTVALVGRYVDQFRDDFFAPRGIETVIYGWDELEDAAQHTTIVLGYGLTSDYNQARFQAFLDATDASGAGVIFTHQAFGSATGLNQLSRHTGQPETTGQNSGGSGSAESFYDITADHPIFAGHSVGDRIVLDNSTQAKWIGWFDNYAGDGRQTIATLGRSGDAIGGGGIGVDQRANNRHVLLASHGVSVTRGPADWTPEAGQLFLNALTWASPPPTEAQPYYAVHDLQLGPDPVKANQPVTVSAAVKNIGSSAGNYEAALVVNGQVAETKSVALAQGESATLEWTVSRADLGVYEVRLEYLTGSFRVRAPIVDLTALAVASDSGAGASAGPLTGATVELIDDGAVVGVGSTGADGTLSFEIPDVSGDYGLVVRRAHINNGDEAYLLHRAITVNDDRSVTFAPQASGSGADAVARTDLRLTKVNADHTAQVFVRPTSTAPYGYGYQPGTLIASTDTYEAVIAHRVNLREQDWWLPSQIVSGLDWTGSGDTAFAFGGTPSADISEVSISEDGQVSVDWSVTDAHGRPFETVLSGDVRPFADLPEVVELEQIEALVRAKASNEQKPILRLYDPTGEQARAGSIEWDAQPYTFALDADATGGQYGVGLEAGAGGYGDTATAAATMQVGDIRLSTTRPDKVVTKSVANYEVRAVNSGAADAGPFTWTVRVASSSGELSPRDVEVKLLTDHGTKRIELRSDGEGGLVGTVADNITLAPGEHVWQMSLQVSGTGEHTFVDHFAGDGVSVATHDKVAGASRLDNRGVGAGDSRLAGVGA